MGERQVTLENTNVSQSRFDVAIEWMLGGLLAFMPLAFGVVHAWSEEIVIALSGMVVFCFLLKLVYYRNLYLIWSGSYAAVAIFLFVVVFQLIPLPTVLVKIISPNTAILKTELLGDLSNADTLIRSMPLTFYSNATEHDLRLAMSVAAVFVVVLNVFRRPDQIKRLLMVISVIGGFVALISLAQNLFGNDKIYWFISSRNSKGYSGPFVNHSNYAQFMNLSIGAALAWLCVELHESFTGKRKSLPDVVEYLTSGAAKKIWLFLAIISFGAATVFISLSRGGMVSVLIAMSFTILLFSWRKSLRDHGLVMIVTALIAFICVLYVGFDAVYDRLASLREFEEAESGRLQILKDIAIAWTKFPMFGTGMGTHSVVYPMFDRSTIPALAAHAENEYAQAAEETGLIGLASLIIFGILIGLNYARSIRGNKLPICSAAYGLGFGILAILIQSLSDFGQHLPANSFLSAIFCALLLVLGGYAQKRNHVTETAISFGRIKGVRSAALFVVTCIWIWAIIGANNFRIAEAYWSKCPITEKAFIDDNWHGTDAEYADLISCAVAASDYQPKNIKYRYWLNVYRWDLISQVTDPNTGAIIISDDLMPTVREIVAGFHEVRALCPSYGPAYSVVGQIEKFILNDNSGAERIRKGFRLAPCDPTVCFVAGKLDILEGRNEDCVEKFEKAVQLNGGLFKSVADIYINQLSRPYLAISSAGDDICRLSYVASVLEDMQYNDLAKEAREKVKNLLEVKCSRPDVSAGTFAYLAGIYEMEQNYEAAIEYYYRALERDYGEVNWRLSMARLLAKTEQVPEAIRQARICLRLRPQMEAAERLIADLSVDPASFAEEIKVP